MTIRERTEAMEYDILSDRASKAAATRGRRLEEEPCTVRTAFQRDRDRILHAKSFRRLKHKTQVFLSPEGDHYRTRLTHTLEVAQIARTIARALRLNEDLTEAIALGHDLGHTPFGHCGEALLNEIHEGGFEHNVQSLRVVDYLEKRRREGYGLNLTEEVRDGILNHRGGGLPFTLEGQIVKLSDRIAYINHDIDDALRAGILKAEAIPEEHLVVLGRTHSERINRLIIDCIETSTASEVVALSPEVTDHFDRLRGFMFREVYLNAEAKDQETRARELLRMLYGHYAEHPEEMPEERYSDYQRGEGIDAVRDYIAGMSDRYAVRRFESLFVPVFWD